MNPEPVPGTVYEFSYLGGRPYDPDRVTSRGVFLKKLIVDGQEYYLVAERDQYRPSSKVFYVYYLDKDDFMRKFGENPDEDFKNLSKAIESPNFKHPKYLRQLLTPSVLISKQEIDNLTGKTAARQKIGNFMTQAIYAPPIRNKNNKVLFTGGPMYKRALARFSTQGNRRGGSRKRNKCRNQTRKH